MLSICSATRSRAPAPSATIVITAATPMTMPSVVSAVRSGWARSARSAERTLDAMRTSGSKQRSRPF